MMGSQAELAHLFRALKMPAAARTLGKLADRARAEEWSYERFVQTLLETEVSPREGHGCEARIRQARFPARKTLEEFDFTFQRSVRKTVIEHLGQLDFLHTKDCIVALGPPDSGSRPSSLSSLVKQSSDGAADLNSQAFSPSGGDLDGMQFAALDLVQNGLPGAPEAPCGLLQR
jgi:IstB-like ATP binding protein